MTSFCLHHTVTVNSGCKSRAHANDKRSVRDLRPEIFLCKDRVHDHIRSEPFTADGFFVHHDRNITVLHDLLCPRLVFHKDALHLLYLRAPLINCSRERYRTPYSERNSYLGHKDLMPCPVESGGDPCRQVPGSSDQYFHSSVSAFLLYRSSPA